MIAYNDCAMADAMENAKRILEKIDERRSN